MSRQPLIAALSSLAVIAGFPLIHNPTAAQVTRDPKEMPRSTIAFVSTRDNPTSIPPFVTAAEIYLMNGDGTDARPSRITPPPPGRVCR